MPKLDFNKTKSVSLPSIPDSEVVIAESMLAGDFLDLMDVDKSRSVPLAVSKIVRSWNLTDEKDEVLAITEENLKKLPIKDLLFLFQEAGLDQLSEELKKKEPTN